VLYAADLSPSDLFWDDLFLPFTLVNTVALEVSWKAAASSDRLIANLKKPCHLTAFWTASDESRLDPFSAVQKAAPRCCPQLSAWSPGASAGFEKVVLM